MKSLYQSAEIPQIDPRVAEMQARAQAHMAQAKASDWWRAPREETPEAQPGLSSALSQWQQAPGSNQAGSTSRPGTPIDASLDDRELLARTLAAEAGGEGYEGIIAAGSVIRNRIGKYGDSLRDVIMKPGHFSAWNSVTGYAGGEGGLNMDSIRPNEDVYRATDALLSGNYQDPTGGRTHYHTGAVKPKWGYGVNPNYNGMKIGNHIFGWGDR